VKNAGLYYPENRTNTSKKINNSDQQNKLTTSELKLINILFQKTNFQITSYINLNSLISIIFFIKKN